MEQAEAMEGEGGKEVRSEMEEAWFAVCERLSGLVSGDAFERWFRAAKLLEFDGHVARIGVPDEIHQVWIETNYLNDLRLALSERFDELSEVRLEIVQAETVVAAPESDESSDDLFPEVQEVSDGNEVIDKRMKRVGLNPLYSFEAFVVGNNSQFAHAACEAVATGKGSAFNPLFIHGGPGLGKTHLMQAVGREWLERSGVGKVVYMTCEKFTNEFIDSVRKGDLQKFRRRYRTAEVMLIDDVQFLGGKERSQEEFFHTFNTLLDGRCQVILTSDRPASEIKNLEPRLVSRFECGLTVELQPPGFVTRLAILKQKSAEWDVRMDEGVIRLLAERLSTNVRRLEGGLMRVATYVSLAQGSVTEDKVEHLLRDLFREENVRQVSIDAIQRMVAERFDIRLGDMTSRRRPASIAIPRQIAMYLSRKMTRSSLVEIGEAFGGRDHGTVIHAVKKVTEQIETDREIRDRVEIIKAELTR